MTRTIPRAEPVGSLLRSPQVLAQLDRVFERSRTCARPLVLREDPERIAELNRIADASVRDLVARQQAAGLDLVTDGEIRRGFFLSSFYDALDGLAEPETEGGPVGFAEPVFVRRLRKAYAPVAEEAAFLRAVADAPFKVTVPAPSGFFADFVDLRGSAYTSHAAFVEDAVGIIRDVVAEAIAAGASVIQFDFPIYPALVAEGIGPMGSMLEQAHAEGETNATMLEKGLAADQAVLAGIPDGVTTALHICRGNLEGGFWSGSLAPVAERIFNELAYQRFLVEWEDVAREGTYEAIRFVPKDRVMVLGLVSTKTRQLEDEDEIVRRVHAAAEHLDLGQLAISPQCGFASMHSDGLVQAEDVQWRKLELVGRVADRIWGTA